MIEIKNLTKHYKNFTLDDVSMEIPSGRITGFIGANGAGKSTTFKAILGLIKTDGGEIIINGKNIKDFSEKDKAQIGCVMTDSFFSDTLRIKDIAKIMKAMFKSFDEKYFLDKCEAFKLPKDKRIRDFSGGMKAKIKVITALSYDSKVLILDEPTVGLDVVVREEVLDLIREYVGNNEERSVIISSHISSDIEKLCDDIYMIHDGKIVFHDDTDKLLFEYAAVKVDEAEFAKLDKKYIRSFRKDKYGYECLTWQKDYYMENYPSVVVEKMSIDEMMMILIKGEKI